MQEVNNDQITIQFNLNDMNRVLNYVKSYCTSSLTAKTREYISEALRIPERKLRAIISHWNGLGEPILCDDNGVYYSQDPEQIARVANRYQSMATNNQWKSAALHSIACKLKAKEMSDDLTNTIKKICTPIDAELLK